MNPRTFETQKYQCFLQGLLYGLLPVFLFLLHFNPFGLPWKWGEICAFVLPLILGTGIALLYKIPAVGKGVISCGMIFGGVLLYPVLLVSPLFSLLVGVTVIASFYYLFSGRIVPFTGNTADLQLERVRGSALSLIILTMLFPLFDLGHKLFSLVCLAGFLILLWIFFKYLSISRKLEQKKKIFLLLFLVGGSSVLLAYLDCFTLFAFFLAVLTFCYTMFLKHEDWKYLTVILEHPWRSVFLTFAFLCAGGTLLLRTPAAMSSEIDVIDAAFTSVSGVCVTGLSVIDISSDLTFMGRFFLMLLIQAGGLGIMTLAALLLHLLGRRLSLNQEQLLTELTPVQEQDVFQCLKQIVKVTFFAESLGAILLIPYFWVIHGNLFQASELGIFTSVSAFCNAGFFPHADNMMPYAEHYFVQIVTASLIITGGIAPAVTVSLLRAGKQRFRLPLVSKLVIGTTLLLLSVSMILLLAFEWDGIFSGLTPAGKIVNGFFLSASLRTAGFNTVAMTGSGVPAVIVMLLCMFIGGSPGGTAGGIKTTTLAMLVLTFRAAIRGETEVELDRHRIDGKCIIQAVAVTSSAALVLLVVIVMLVTTQTIGAKEVIFESVSALGTVGLSLGATGELDTIGKMIIMITMFIGRIGPLTLFLLLSDRQSSQTLGYPPVRLPLG